MEFARRVLVLDEKHRAGLWDRLVPCSTILAPSDGNLVEQLKRETGASSASSIIINLDLSLKSSDWVKGDEVDYGGGATLVSRICQEVSLCGAPLLLVSYRTLSSIENSQPEVVKLLKRHIWFVQYLRLPTDQASLETAMDRQIAAYWGKPCRSDELREIARRTCDSALKTANRYSQGTLGAAVWLLVGGLVQCAISGSNYLETIGKLSCTKGLGNYDFGPATRLGDLYNHSPASIEHRKRQVLIVDDEHDHGGWSIVLASLFPGWELDTCIGPSELERKDVSAYDLILLDFSFDGEEKTGLNCIVYIRNSSPFVPTVLFTGAADVKVYTEAVDRAVNTCFVKRKLVNDAEEAARDYLSMARQIETLTRFDRKCLEAVTLCWRLAIALRNGQRESEEWNDGKSPISHAHDAAQLVLKSLYFASYVFGLYGGAAENESRMAQMPLGNLWRRALAALDRACCADCGKTKKAAFYASENAGNLELRAALKSEGINYTINMRKWMAKCSHLMLEPKDHETLIRWLNKVSEVLTFACNRWGARSIAYEPTHEFPSYSIEAFRRIVRASHNQSAINGARRIVAGYALEFEVVNKQELSELEAAKDDEFFFKYIEETISDKGLRSASTRASPKDTSILLLDDNPDKSNWVTALNLILGEQYQVYALRIDSEFDIELLTAWSEQVGIILLDLHLPSAKDSIPNPENGIDILRELRSNDVNCPVVMMSAEDSPIWGARCIAEGAQDYFCKGTHINSVELNDADFYKDYYKKLIDVIGRCAKIPRTYCKFGALANRLGSRNSSRYVGLDHLNEATKDGIRRALGHNSKSIDPSHAFATLIEENLSMVGSLYGTVQNPTSAALWKHILQETGEAELSPTAQLFLVAVGALEKAVLVGCVVRDLERRLSHKTSSDGLTSDDVRESVERGKQLFLGTSLYKRIQDSGDPILRLLFKEGSIRKIWENRNTIARRKRGVDDNEIAEFMNTCISKIEYVSNWLAVNVALDSPVQLERSATCWSHLQSQAQVVEAAVDSMKRGKSARTGGPLDTGQLTMLKDAQRRLYRWRVADKFCNEWRMHSDIDALSDFGGWDSPSADLCAFVMSNLSDFENEAQLFEVIENWVTQPRSC